MAKRRSSQIPAHLHGAAKKYLWSKGSRLSGDPQLVGERIAQIIQTHGGKVEAADILKDAQKKSSPLHDYFEWDDAVAAHEYRLTQAREILRSIKVEITDAETQEIGEIRAFMVPDEQSRGEERLAGYRPIEDIMANPELRAMKIQEAWSQLEAWKARYEGLSELAEVFRLIAAGPPAVKKKSGRRKAVAKA